MNPRKPTSLKKLHGTERADRAVSNEMVDKRPVGTAPERLETTAKQAFARFAREFKCAGLSQSDRLALEQIADAYAEYCTLKERLRAEPPTFVVTDSLGNEVIRANPAVKLMQATRQQMVTLIREFGGTPSSRSGISLGRSNDDDFDDFLSGTQH